MATTSQNPIPRYDLHDALGSVIAQVSLDEDEPQVVWAAQYGAYGKTLAQSSKTPSPYQWVGAHGYYADEDVGMYLMGYRWYDSFTGRFISRDPIGFGGGDMNLYRAFANNPVNEADPWGAQTGLRPDDKVDPNELPEMRDLIEGYHRKRAWNQEVVKQAPAALGKALILPVVIAGVVVVYIYAPGAATAIKITATRSLSRPEIATLLAWLASEKGRKFIETAGDVAGQLPLPWLEGDPTLPTTGPGAIVWAVVKADEAYKGLSERLEGLKALEEYTKKLRQQTQPTEDIRKIRQMRTIDCHRPR